MGTIPPPRFSTGDLFEDDVDFCYGSRNGLFWPIMEKIFDTELEFENTQRAVEQRKELLARHRIGICDIVEQCERVRVNAADLGMQNIRLRNIVAVLKEHPLVNTLLFMGGNSKNGPEYLFRRHLKEYKRPLELVSNEIPKIHRFRPDKKFVKTVSLISPSNAANRSIGASNFYKKKKKEDKNYTTFLFRLNQYKNFFIE